MREMSFTKGQEVLLVMKEDGNAFRHTRTTKPNYTFEDMIVPATVKSVNKKYVTVYPTAYGPNTRITYKFEVEENYREHTNYSAEYEVYDTFENAKNVYDARKLYAKLRDSFYRTNKDTYTKEQLEAVVKILGIE